MEISIIEAQENHYVGFLEVFKELEEFHRINAEWHFKKPDLALFDETHFLKLINDQNCFFFLALNNSQIVWYVIAHKRDAANIPVLKERARLYIEDIVVKKSHRENWIGSLLLNKIELLAKENDLHEIELNVRMFNKDAIEFYEHKWYEPYSQRMRKVI